MVSKQNNADFSLLANHIGGNVLIVEDEFVVANDLEIILEKAEYQVTGIASSVKEALDLIAHQKPDIVLLDIILQGQETGIDLAGQLSLMCIPFIYLSANSNQSIVEAAKTTQPYGFLVKPFREKDVLITLQLALYRHAHSVEAYLRKEQALQIALSDTLSSCGDWKQKLHQIGQLFQPFIPFDFLLAGMVGSQDSIPLTGLFRIGFEEFQYIGMHELSQMNGLAPEKVKDMLPEYSWEPGISEGEDFTIRKKSDPFTQLLAKTFRLESTLNQVIELTHGGLLVISFYSRQSTIYLGRHLSLLERLKNPLSLTLDRYLAFEEIEKLRQKLEQENQYLQEEVKTTVNFNEIIGESPSLHVVFDQVRQVSGTDTSVLILGESGTGKELIARSIHNLSPRKNKLLVKINCAALPPNLIESELFGHEKGAFTGAIDKRIGKFELANEGSLFLDEIGEMPLDLQVKLLRVLQEKEIERVGGKGPIKTDVRIIAATNRNLEKEVAEGRFRLDLYYRLNVFPIVLPALKERSEDIPLLANFFGQKLCKKIGRPFQGISDKVITELLNYQWPGNIRELQNIIEQAVIVNDGQSPLDLGRPLVNKITSNSSIGGLPSFEHPKTLSEVKQLQQETEREYILSILKKANGRIRGKNGAAELLNLKPTTLESRMEKLGISRSDI
ncbi:sigma 54-interacting transcriptional regulator [Desertivirga brevis]|uniref:sigma 54-interacting transcriptional regulator n=1 Tax=Desertivirga brevis TaxID=2810310 RepID=UPI001A9661BF|nr:sigma 54-interacting transcriptional regulator [Pedobacter sp. SYSU D00873]